MAVLDERDWGSHYELTFGLWLERAECELLSGNFEKAEQLIVELLQRATSNVEFADASCLKVQLHVLKGEYSQAVDSALTCLRLFSIDLPAHPTLEQVQAEYETVWQTLNGRPIESLIDLPMMTDPELQAAMHVLSVLASPAYFTDFHLFCLFACPMVRISMQHGISGASAHGCSVVGFILGPVFHRYGEGYRFAKLACDLVGKHGFIAHQAKVHYAMGTVAFWTQPIGTAIDFMRATFRNAIETGDLTFACYGMFQSVTGLLLRNDPLDAVWRESEMALDFAREAKYGAAADIIRSQQRFIATLQGRTAGFSTFSDVQFDEATFEAQLTGDRMTLMIAWYWILKLNARFLSGDYAEALAAADKVKPLLSAAAAQIQLLGYFYYTALTVAACYENASADEKQGWRELLTAHQEQLREWAETYPPTFADKHALVLAEIARLEGRDADAMRLYEQAIRLAREHGFVQNEGVAHELAAGFYLGRGSTTAARAHLEGARNCFARWGALGKVQQLDQRYPWLREKTAPSPPTATLGTPVEQLDVGTVLKAAQAVSGEIVLGKLIEKLMRIALEHAGAERGLLILFPGDEPRIEAEATTGRGRIEVTLRQTAASPAELPESVLQYVIRTRESVILDDATAPTLFSADAYVRQRRPRSVLCLPLVKQAKLVGTLYLENNLTPHAFTSGRIAVLELLASQAAISLENAALYSDLQRSEAFLADGQRMSHTGSFSWNVSSGEIYWSEETYKIFEYHRGVKLTLELVLQRIHPDDRDLVQQAIDHATNEKTYFDIEHRLVMPDGSVKHLHAVARTSNTSSGNLEFVGAVTDVTAAKQAEESLRESKAYLAEAQRLSHTGSWAWAPGTRELRYCSEECYRVLGFDPQGGQPRFKTFFQRIHPDDQAKARATAETAGREKAEFELDYRIVHPGGEIRDIHVVGHPVLSPSGDLVEFVGTVIDVTERKRSEDALRDAQADLARAARLATMGELTTLIAHEVNQPLTAIVTNADTCLSWLTNANPNLDGARQAAERVVRNGHRAGNIVKSIRALARKSEPEMAQFDINEAIGEILVLLRSELRRQSVSLETELSDGIEPVTGDRVQLQQVVLNLVMNGIEAMSAVMHRSRILRVISQLQESGDVLIAVMDVGSGLDPTNIDRIFDAFFTTKPEGMGMGLAICRSIIEAHGGLLWASPQQPHGSVFQFTLPAGINRRGADNATWRG